MGDHYPAFNDRLSELPSDLSPEQLVDFLLAMDGSVGQLQLNDKPSLNNKAFSCNKAPRRNNTTRGENSKNLNSNSNTKNNKNGANKNSKDAKFGFSEAFLEENRVDLLSDGGEICTDSKTNAMTHDGDGAKGSACIGAPWEKKASQRRRKKKAQGPYLDVMTFSTCHIFCGGSDPAHILPHHRLLHQPLQLPDLSHIAVNAKSTDQPLFYPDGTKSVKFRETIRESLRSTLDAPEMNLSIDMLSPPSSPGLDVKEQLGELIVPPHTKSPYKSYKQLRKTKFGTRSRDTDAVFASTSVLSTSPLRSPFPSAASSPKTKSRGGGNNHTRDDNYSAKNSGNSFKQMQRASASKEDRASVAKARQKEIKKLLEGMREQNERMSALASLG